MQSLYHRIGQKPSLIILGMLLVATVFVLSIGKNARLVTDLDEYMPQNHPAFVFSTQAEEQFGIEDKILLLIEHPDSIYNRTCIRQSGEY